MDSGALGDALYATQYIFLQSEKFIYSFYLFSWLEIQNRFSVFNIFWISRVSISFKIHGYCDHFKPIL